ncbi:hypothetical protein LIER_00957 [Lithospermum erythrorhizon]|uniref:Uncharacterized protein n=1 Tax=Lithospermum erythrorhizon TaxID=34254 RepID=A0AAV3NKQ4_LITER
MRMRKKGSSKKMWRVVCRSNKKNLKTERSMDIGDILKMKLETIKEEPEIMVCEENKGILMKHRSMVKNKAKKIQLKIMGRFFTSQFSLKESYVVFMAGLTSKGGLNALPQYS